MITVIADDLTGAAEITGICLRYGVDVSFAIDSIPEKVAQVTVIATDSRSLTEKDAYQIHFQLANEIFKKNGASIIFKKCDSVLRGHVLTELSALLRVSQKAAVLLQPSNPDANRCINEGVYFVNSSKIEDTAFSSDPDFPATKSSVQTMLLNRTSNKVHLGLYTGKIAKISSGGIYIPDCSNENDLIESLSLYSEDCLIGGSAAFFEQLLIKFKIALRKKEPKKFSFSKDYIVVSGSTHHKSVKFAKSLQLKGCPLLVLPSELLQINVDEFFINGFIDNCAKVYSENEKLILRISDDIIQFENSSTILRNRLNFIVTKLFEILNISELCVEGGATAYDLFKKLNWQLFTPTEELALGVVRMKYNLDEKIHVILKPGSYKWPNRLLN